jgi:transcriptional regulator with XRE-family HTH domain
MSRNTTPPPEVDPEHDELAYEFGRRVRALRDRGELTLEDLATRLSKVERGEKNPTIGVAKRIAHALDTTLSFLTGGVEDRQAVIIVRHNQRHVFRDSKTGFERHLLTPTMVGSRVELLQHLLPAGVSTGMMPAYRNGTEKHIAVTEGDLIVSLPGQDVYLAEGDALFFEAKVEHGFTNRTKKPCTYYVVISHRDDK